MDKYIGPFSQSGYNKYAFDILLDNLWFFFYVKTTLKPLQLD